MKLNGKTVVALAGDGDVPSIVVAGDEHGVVTLSINDRDTDDSSDATPLITGIATRAQAIKLARAILAAAGADIKRGDRFSTKFDYFTVDHYESDTEWRVKYDDGLVIGTRKDSFANYCKEFEAKKEEV